MPRIYGHYHSIALFIARCIPNKGSGSFDEMFVNKVIDGLKRLDRVQQTNRAVTLPFDVDGINVFHNGLWLCKIFPRQAWLMVAFEGEGVAEIFDEAVNEGRVIDVTGSSYRAWRVPPENLEVVWTFVEGLPLIKENAKEIGKHPRTFPGAARQLALEAFKASGRVCPGSGKQKKHRLKSSDRIEFDHILPYAEGGPSSDWNIQVLCQACNRLKRARAG